MLLLTTTTTATAPASAPVPGPAPAPVPAPAAAAASGPAQGLARKLRVSVVKVDVAGSKLGNLTLKTASLKT